MIPILLQALDIICESKLWANKKPSEIFRILMYADSKKWLYTPMVDGKVQAVICAYRIQEGESLKEMPLEDEGNFLYIAFVLSINKDADLFKISRETLRSYIQDNPDIKEIILEDKNNKIKRFKIGDNYGEESRLTTPSNADVSK